MKAKLLRRVKKKIKLYKRNSLYLVDIGSLVSVHHDKESAYEYYRFWIIKEAVDYFGNKPKKRLR